MNSFQNSQVPKTAVALHYDGVDAPRILAKGKGLNGEQIIQLALQHDIPLHKNKDLVEVLSCIPLGSEIPQELYVAVADVLSFIYFLNDLEQIEKNKT